MRQKLLFKDHFPYKNAQHTLQENRGFTDNILPTTKFRRKHRQFTDGLLADQENLVLGILVTDF